MKSVSENRENILAQPYFSVIVPIYNGERFLKRCIASILRQTFSDYELILVDDGSTDRSSAICQRYSKVDSRICYIKKENQGSFRTRIRGVSQAKGKYILFCDVDDHYVTKSAFQTIYNTLEKCPCDLLQFGHFRKYYFIKKIQKISGKSETWTNDEFLVRDYPSLLCNTWNDSPLTCSVWGKAYRRELFIPLLKRGSLDRIFWGDDLITNLCILYECRSFVSIPEPLYVYYAKTGGTNRFSERAMYDLDKIKQTQAYFLDKLNHKDYKYIRNSQLSEVASWFYLYVQDCIQKISREKLRPLILDILQLKSFQETRDYYAHENTETWEAVALIRKSDPDEYIRAACARPKSSDILSVVRKITDNLVK